MINYNALLWTTFAFVLVAIALGIVGTIAYGESKKSNQYIKNLTSEHITVSDKAVFGNYTGLDTFYKGAGTPEEDDLAVNTVTTIDYTGQNNFSLTLPEAKKTNRVVLVLGNHVNGGVQHIQFLCKTGDTYQEGTLYPTTNSDSVLEYKKIGSGITEIVYTPAAADTNLLSTGTAFEFICDKDGEWQLGVDICTGTDQTSNLTGTILTFK